MCSGDAVQTGGDASVARRRASPAARSVISRLRGADTKLAASLAVLARVLAAAPAPARRGHTRLETAQRRGAAIGKTRPALPQRARPCPGQPPAGGRVPGVPAVPAVPAVPSRVPLQCPASAGRRSVALSAAARLSAGAQSAGPPPSISTACACPPDQTGTSPSTKGGRPPHLLRRPHGVDAAADVARSSTPRIPRHRARQPPLRSASAAGESKPAER